MANRLTAVLSWITAAILLLPAGATAAATPFGNQRGLNMPAAVWGKRASADAPSVYQLQPRRHSPKLVAQVAAAGFGFVRLVVTPVPLMTTDTAARGNALDWIGRLVDDYRATGVGVIVDLHFWPTDTPLDQDHVVPDPGARAPLIQAQVALARYLAERGDRQVALELVNEPPCNAGGKPFDWPPVQRMMVARVRAVAPRLPLVLTACRGLRSELLKLDAAPYRGDPAIFWTIHYYDPGAFIGQQGDGLHGVPFPPDPALAKSAAAQAAMLPPAGAPRRHYLEAQLNTYLLTHHGQATIAVDMAAVAGWARRQHVRPDHIFIGEFGAGFAAATMPSPRADELRWLRAVREEASRQRFAWCYWALPAPGDTNYDPATGFFQAETLRAFGLPATPDPQPPSPRTPPPRAATP